MHQNKVESQITKEDFHKLVDALGDTETDERITGKLVDPVIIEKLNNERQSYPNRKMSRAQKRKYEADTRMMNKFVMSLVELYFQYCKDFPGETQAQYEYMEMLEKRWHQWVMTRKDVFNFSIHKELFIKRCYEFLAQSKQR